MVEHGLSFVKFRRCQLCHLEKGVLFYDISPLYHRVRLVESGGVELLRPAADANLQIIKYTDKTKQ